MVSNSTEQLLTQWEPKVHAMLRGLYTDSVHIEYEDAAQELRIAIIRSAHRWNPADGRASFHTYLHVAMTNTIRKMIAKSQRRLSAVSLEDGDFVVPHNDKIELWEDVFSRAKLSCGESIIADLLLCGYNSREIVNMSVNPESTLKSLQSLKRKCKKNVKAIIFQN